jgi:hypothetical protein
MPSVRDLELERGFDVFPLSLCPWEKASHLRHASIDGKIHAGDV